ncbi:MAG TPA: DUF2225 domain-containing protein, partial [Desulfitobacteriaceae bacterium]|nr:DUF2225 domain-containing protein [Desulfitobacteriaceae bacterium]
PFTSLKLRSRFTVPYQIDSDFCQHFRDKELNPYYYYVNVCPQCGYAFSEEFSSRFPRGARELIEAQMKDQWEKRDLCKLRDLRQAIDSYKLAIYTGSLKKERHGVMGGLCLRLAWIYRLENNTEQEQRFLGLALKEFEESYLVSDFLNSSLSELNTLYFCGELNRRLGNLPKAISYFSKIFEHPERDEEPKMLNMAREQRRVTFEQNRLNQEKQV